MKALGRSIAGCALFLASVLFGCAPNVSGGPGPSGEGGSGGSQSATGGAPASGGTTGTTGSGGASATGGAPAMGGATGTGGAAATGGATGSGGAVATGGTAGTGKGGTTGTGGTGAAGGAAAKGGATGTGGTPASGGATGTGGTAATGGATGAAGSGGSTTGGPIDLTGRKALFLVDSPSSMSDNETIVMEVLQERGLVVTVGASTGPASLAAGMNVVVVSDSAGAGDFVPVFGTVAVPMIVFGNSAYSTLGWTPSSSAKGTVSSTTMVTMTSTATPLASDLGAGTSFTAILSTTSTSLYWGSPGGSPIAVASVMSSPTQLIDFAFEKGAATATGTAPARRVGLAFKTSAVQNLTISGFKLLSAAIDWTAGS
jgi:hypothetical protein